MSTTASSISPAEFVRSANSSRVAYAVGGISFGISSVHPAIRLTLDRGVMEFQTEMENCDVEVEADWADHLVLPAGNAVFESGGLWSAYSEHGGLSLYFQTDYLGPAPYKRAWFNPDFTRGRVSLLSRYFTPEIPVYPLEYPLDELLMIHKISSGEGFEVHSCGVVTADGTGRLFVGHSGAGKSTSSRLWLKQPGARVLSDDRIIVRLHDGVPYMYGTPWHGDAGLAAPVRSPVHGIYLLQHGKHNEIVQLPLCQAAAEVFARVFAPYHNPVALTRTLSLVEKIVSLVSVSQFRFRPDESAIEEILLES